MKPLPQFCTELPDFRTACKKKLGERCLQTFEIIVRYKAISSRKLGRGRWNPEFWLSYVSRAHNLSTSRHVTVSLEVSCCRINFAILMDQSGTVSARLAMPNGHKIPHIELFSLCCASNFCFDLTWKDVDVPQGTDQEAPGWSVKSEVSTGILPCWRPRSFSQN